MAVLSGITGMIVALVILAGAANRSLVVSDLRAIEEKGPVRSVAFSPDSRTVAVGTERNEDQRLINGEAALFDVQTGDMTRRFVQNIRPFQYRVRRVFAQWRPVRGRHERGSGTGKRETVGHADVAIAADFDRFQKRCGKRRFFS